MANLFQLGRSLIKGTKDFGKSFVPPKRVPKPGKYPIAPKAQAEMKKAYDTAKAGREKAFSRQIMAGAGTVLATGYAMNRDKPKATPAPTRTAPKPQAAAQAPAPRKRLIDYQPKVEKKEGLLGRVASSFKRDTASAGKTSTSKVSTGEKFSGISNRQAQDKRRNRKSDSRLGSFSTRTRSNAASTQATPRAEIDYSAPMWTGNTPTNMASYGKATKAPEPKVRTEIKQSKYGLGNASDVVKPRSYRGKRLRSDAKKPESIKQKKETPKTGRKSRRSYNPYGA